MSSQVYQLEIFRILVQSVISIPIIYFVYYASKYLWLHRKFKHCSPSKNSLSESVLAYELLDNLEGIEIGASAHNSFCLNTINVNFTNDTTIAQNEEIKRAGTSAMVDVVAPGDNLPFSDESFDFVISSHVIEHFYDPIKAIQEWLRVIRRGGYVYMIIPDKERTFDKPKKRTTLNELIERHQNPNPNLKDDHGHHSIWITEDLIEISRHFNWTIIAVQEVDDKVVNGFTIVLQKQ